MVKFSGGKKPTLRINFFVIFQFRSVVTVSVNNYPDLYD